MINLLLPELIYCIFRFLSKFDLYFIKQINKQFHEHVIAYKTNHLKTHKLFGNKIYVWSKLLELPEKMLENVVYSYKFDEEFIIMLGLLLTDEINRGKIMKFGLIPHYQDKQQSLLEFQITNNIIFTFDLNKLLTKLDKHDDNVIKTCISHLPNFIRKAKRPWSFQNDPNDPFDFHYNPEEFFWCPQAFIDEDWLKRQHPCIYQALNL